MPRPPRSDEDIRSAVEHVRYEFDMFKSTAEVLMMGLFGPGQANNAFLEAHALHARALIQFFFPENARPDDVLADDYFDDPSQWHQIRGDLPPALAKINSRVGKEVAHLTYARLDVTPEAKGWNIFEIHAAMSEVVRRFEEAAALDRIGHTVEWAGS